MIIQCAHCGIEADKPAGYVNRARTLERRIFCSRVCSGLARRQWKAKDQKVAEKAAYDALYREKNRTKLKAKKAAHYRANPNREREKAYREANMQRHVEYCRRPEYRAAKKVYDRQYRAEKFYGELAEAFVLTLEIRDAALEKAGGDYELRLMKGTLNKAIKRRCDYERLDRKEPENSPLGNLELGERR